MTCIHTLICFLCILLLSLLNFRTQTHYLLFFILHQIHNNTPQSSFFLSDSSQTLSPLSSFLHTLTHLHKTYITNPLCSILSDFSFVVTKTKGKKKKHFIHIQSCRMLVQFCSFWSSHETWRCYGSPCLNEAVR